MGMSKLRFKADDGSTFPAWEEKRLSDIVDRVTRKNKANETDIPLTISSIDGLVDQRDYFKKTVASKDMSGYYLLKNGEFAYNKSYSVGFDCGSIKRLDKYPCGALSTLYICFGLKPDANIDSDYMAYSFDSQKWNPEVKAICAEGARNHGLLNVPTTDFFNIKVSLPSLPEQRKIADLLSAVDAVIAAQQAEVDAWKQRKKGVMQKLFSQEVRFKADDGSEFPEWEEKTLGDLGRLRNGYAFKSDSYVPHGKYRVITIANVQGERYVTELERANTVNQIPDNIASWQILKESDILISLTGNIGRVSLNTGCNNLLNQRVGLFEVFSPISDRQWVFQRLSANDFRNAMEGAGQGAAQKNISRGDVESFPLSVPSLPEQRKIADCLASMDEVIQKAKDELAKWQELKKGLLQQMFV